MSATYLEDERLLQDDRVVDLLTLQATAGLGPDDAAELERLLAEHRGADREVLERVAAAVMLAGTLDDEPLPASLRDQLVARGEAWVREARRAPVADLGTARAAREAAGRAPGAPADANRWGWWAAAAAVVIAIAGWYPRFASTPVARAPVETPPVATPRELTPAEQRAALLASTPADRLVRWTWATTDDPAAKGVQGDVVWDPATQQGYMRFVGLPANDARDHQYQLWIFDANRDDRYPVDGGVFDVGAAGEVVVPIHPRLPVAKAALFAVTVEKPGGVVVSSRERIVVLAKPAQA
jgi:hypothetical protein